MLRIIMLDVISAERYRNKVNNIDFHYAECHYADSHV